MSYILDALRRADSERERGQIPGIHAQPVAPLPLDEPIASGLSPTVWGAGLVAALLSGALAWWWLSGERPMAAPAPAPAAAAVAAAAAPALPPAPPAAPAPAPVPSPVPAPAALPPALTAQPRQGVAGAAGPAATPAPVPAAVAVPRTAVAALPPRPNAAPPLAAAPGVDATAAAAEPRDATTPPAVVPKAAPSVAPRSPPAARGAASAAAEAEPRVQALHELPEEVRRAVPPLVVNGSVYSKNPADRFLIVNGQIVHETDTVAPNVVVERIGPRSAVLGIHGHRFEISY